MRRVPAVLVLTLMLTGCAQGSEDRKHDDTFGSAPTPTQPAQAEQELQKAYLTYVSALLRGDSNVAYDLLTARCRENLTLPEFASETEDAPDLYGKGGPEIITVQAIGRHGIVVVTYPSISGAVEEPWLLEHGEWRSDGCKT